MADTLDLTTLAQKGQSHALRIKVLLTALDNALADASFPADTEAERRSRGKSVEAAMLLSDIAKEQAEQARAVAEQIETADCEQRHGRSVPAVN